MTINYQPTLKQHLLHEYIYDTKTTEILFGGAASGGKSYGICSEILMLCLTKPGIRIGLARKNYTTLKKTTLISLIEVASNWGVNNTFNYNSQTGTIKFNNTSEIILVDLDYIPSEPNYERLQGLLLTCAFVDEAGELVEKKGYDTLFSRCGRWKNKELNVKQFICSTCNPSQNFLKEEFYDKARLNKLEEHKSFIPALITDNHYMDESYKESLLKTLDTIQIKRLVYGEWEYSSSDVDLFLIDDINKMYFNDVTKEDDQLFASVDLATDRDDTIAVIWKGNQVIDIIKADLNINNISFIKKILTDFNIPPRNLVYDASGLGADIKRHLPYCVPFLGNAKPFNGENYTNLRNQAYFTLSNVVSNGGVGISIEKEKERLRKELLTIKRKDIIDNKVSIIDKKEIKRYLNGKSPDLADALMMKMIFNLKKPATKPKMRFL